MSPVGTRRPTVALQHVGSYVGYTGCSAGAAGRRQVTQLGRRPHGTCAAHIAFECCPSVSRVLSIRVTTPTTGRKSMTRNIARFAASISVTLGTLLGLTTTTLADEGARRPLTIQLPPKSCTWMGAGTDHWKTVASGATTKDTSDNTTWKCSDGHFSQVGGPPAIDPRHR